MIRATCHCGAVVLEANAPPPSVTSCNCSICRRSAVLHAYYTRSDARLVAGHDALAKLPVRHFDGADTWQYLD